MRIKVKNRKCKQCIELGRIESEISLLESALDLLEPQKKGKGHVSIGQELPALPFRILSSSAIEFYQETIFGHRYRAEVCECGCRLRIFLNAVDPVANLKEKLRVASCNLSKQRKPLNELQDAA